MLVLPPESGRCVLCSLRLTEPTKRTVFVHGYGRGANKPQVLRRSRDIGRHPLRAAQAILPDGRGACEFRLALRLQEQDGLALLHVRPIRAGLRLGVAATAAGTPTASATATAATAAAAAADAASTAVAAVASHPATHPWCALIVSSSPPQPRRLLREALGSAGSQAPCWEWPGTAWPSTGCCLR